ncbi:PRC-barrel domain-containing protein [Streptomyces sp. NPDC059513]|uniref:PRC-barrel domain-containing protein n=1 Tax=unclassified Streptomyces TaxID=2593676 RepID=UPI001849B3E3|nr:PRC-barrel domain containing protein [Streptomyces sp. SJ1-7]
MSDSLWGYQPSSGHTADADLSGYSVEATDGGIGKVDKHSDEAGSAYLLVDTGSWIFGKDVLLPAGTVRHIDTEGRKVHVDLTKEQVKDSPEFDRHQQTEDPGYHAQVSAYYMTFRIM